MFIYVNLHKQQGSILGLSLLFLSTFSFILLSSLELHLKQIQSTQLFYHKAQLLNQAESRLKSNLNSSHLSLDHQDACGNQYYVLEASASDVLAAAHLGALLMKPALKWPVGCKAQLLKLIYQAMD